MFRRSLLIVGLLVMWAAPVAAGGGGGCHGPITDGEGTAVDISKSCFTPTVVRVQPGATVTWTNLDAAEHNVYSSAFERGGMVFGEGQSYDVTFADAGVFPYVCTIHPGMTGAVVVGDANVPTAAEAPSKNVAAVEASAPEVGATDVTALEQRLAVVEASLVSPPAQSQTWPPLVIGLLGGLVLGGLVLRIRADR